MTDIAAARLIDSFGVSFDIVIRYCDETELPLLEWFGAFTHQRAIIRDTYELQRNNQAVMLVAAIGAFPVGQAWMDFRLKPGAEGPMVWAVRVFEPFQRAGIGARLMAGLERMARERGHNRLELGVEKDNASAREFYERLGWRVARERLDSYAYTTPEGQAVVHALDEWVLVKNIGQAGGASPTRA